MDGFSTFISARRGSVGIDIVCFSQLMPQTPWPCVGGYVGRKKKSPVRETTSEVRKQPDRMRGGCRKKVEKYLECSSRCVLREVRQEH